MNLEELVDDWLRRHSKAALARQVGCSPVTLNKKLSGESELTFGEAERLAYALGVSIETISDAVKATDRTARVA